MGKLGHVERCETEKGFPGRQRCGPQSRGRTCSTGGSCGVHGEQGSSPPVALPSGALNATARACFSILYILGRQKDRQKDDESGRVGRVDRRGKRLGVERPFKRLLQNQFS